MSVGNSVFLKRRSIPTLVVWAQAIQNAGFSLTLDPELNMNESTGYRLGAYGGEEAGFEYSVEVVAGRDNRLRDEELRRIGERDVEIIFTSRSRLRDLMASSIAGAVLASITDGIFWSHEAGELLSGDEALKWAREMEVNLRAELAQEAALPPPPAPPTNTTPVAQDVKLKAKVVFRGGTLLTIETLEQPIPRRFNLNLVTSELPEVDEVTVLGLWQRPGRDTIVRRITMKPKGLFSRTVERTFDVGGSVRLEPSQIDLDKWVAKLGQVEAATQMLMAAGLAAVPALIAAAGDDGRPVMVRQLALQLVGLVGKEARDVLPALAELSKHPEVGQAAQSAMKRINT